MSDEPVKVTHPSPRLLCHAIVIDQLGTEPHPCGRLAEVLRPSGDVSYYPLCGVHALRVLESGER